MLLEGAPLVNPCARNGLGKKEKQKKYAHKQTALIVQMLKTHTHKQVTND